MGCCICFVIICVYYVDKLQWRLEVFGLKIEKESCFLRGGSSKIKSNEYYGEVYSEHSLS